MKSARCFSAALAAAWLASIAGCASHPSPPDWQLNAKTAANDVLIADLTQRLANEQHELDTIREAAKSEIQKAREDARREIDTIRGEMQSQVNRYVALWQSQNQLIGVLESHATDGVKAALASLRRAELEVQHAELTARLA